MNTHILDKVSANGVEYTVTHDANGNMTYGPDLTDFANPAYRTITYNAENMATEIDWAQGGSYTTTTITYDGDMGRAKKTVDGGSTTYYYGDHYEVTDSVSTKYIFAGNLRIARISNGATQYFHKDHLSSSSLLTDASENVRERAEYRPFGELRYHYGPEMARYGGHGLGRAHGIAIGPAIEFGDIIRGFPLSEKDVFLQAGQKRLYLLPYPIHPLPPASLPVL